MASLGPWRGTFDPFQLDLWDPFEMWEPTPTRSKRGSPDDVAAYTHVYVDWRETDTAHIFRVDLPGVKKEKVKVSIQGKKVLQISGEWTKEEEAAGDTWHRAERKRGAFRRRFRLPKNADVERVTCSMENGVLTVTVPKKEAPQAASRAIAITWILVIKSTLLFVNNSYAVLTGSANPHSSV